MILDISGVLVQDDIIREHFCCDLAACHGACCEEGDAGAPVTLDEIAALEAATDDVWPQLTAQAQAVIDRQGVAYADPEGEMVTSIVGGRDCVYACHADGCCLCALERAATAGLARCQKPISCALYPIREVHLPDGGVGIQYHRWEICRSGVALGRKLQMPLYRFLRGPLVRRFGQEWYHELEIAAEMLSRS